MAVGTRFDHHPEIIAPNHHFGDKSKKPKPILYLSLKPEQGGLEARDFCNIFLRIIEKYCVNNNITYEIINENDHEIILRLEQELSQWSWLEGHHKLVRVSPFGHGDKIHTSMCKITLSTPDKKLKFNIEEKDLKMDFFKSSGPGGQHKNKTMSAVRLTHVPTKTVAISCSQRSQNDNKKYALEQLMEKLADQENQLIKINKEDRRKTNLSQKQTVLNFYFNHKFVTNEITGKKSSLLKNILNGDLSLLK